MGFTWEISGHQLQSKKNWIERALLPPEGHTLWDTERAGGCASASSSSNNGPMRVLLVSFLDDPQLAPASTFPAYFRDASLASVDAALVAPTGTLSEAWRDASLPFIELEARPPRPASDLRSRVSRVVDVVNAVSFIGSVAKTFDVIQVLDPSARTVGSMAARFAKARMVELPVDGSSAADLLASIYKEVAR
jgi:hypothetical protein